jgi:F-type H+-transporting ATPase subunit gamma
LKSVKNIEKITLSMKMVSAAKYARADKELKLARPFGEGTQTFYKSVEATVPEDAKSEVVIMMTSDKGLCGAVHSSVTRKVRTLMQTKPNVKLICVGDKARAGVQRLFGKNILFSVKELGRLPPLFADAGKIASYIFNSDFEYDVGAIYYNRSIHAASYETSELPIYSQKSVYVAPKISLYDSLDTDVVQSYLEYSLASLIYYTMKENAASEQSARMTAMDSSSRNAGDMIGALQLAFNRTRQAVITRELIEIISGASALE